MKKSIKILTLVLSLALICGALVVAAFAEGDTEITGVRWDASGDFEDPLNSTITKPTAPAEGATSGTSKTTNLEQDNGAAKILMLKYQFAKTETDGKAGDFGLVTNPNDENTYMTGSYAEGETASTGHFLEHYTAINGWPSPSFTEDSNEYFDEFKYYVVDFDVAWFDVANYDGTGFFYPYSGYTTTTLNSSGKNTRVDVNTKLGLNFAKEDGKVVAEFRGDTSGAYYELGNEEWSHVTWIMEPIVFTDTDGAPNLKVKQYLAIDGEVVGTYEWTNAVAATNMYGSNRVRYYTADVRYDPFGKKGTPGCTDNYNFRTLTNEYNGNLADVLAEGVGADLTTFESSLYKADYAMPFGELTATIGEAKYDTLDKAIAAYDGTAPIVLQKDIATDVVLNKVVEIQCGEYTLPEANVSAAEGYKVVYNADDNIFTSQTTSGKLTIYWDVCTCGLDDCDETHPGDVEVTGYEGQRIGDTYTKSQDWSIMVGPTKYYLTGWIDDYDEPVDLTTEITAEMCKDAELYLYPVIETTTVPISYVKGGATLYTDSLSTALTNADAGTTVTLHDDVKYNGATINISKAVTLDLAGNTLEAVHTADDFSGRQGLFYVNANFTVVGEQEGSALISYYASKDNVKDDGTIDTTIYQSNNPTFAVNTANITLTIKGANLYANAAQLMRINKDGAIINIDGGTYAKDSVSDGYAPVYFGGGIKDGVVNVKNATITSSTFFSSLNTVNTLNIDNCKLLGSHLFRTSNDAGYAKTTITNSYIASNCIGAGATVTIGEGCYVKDDSWIDNTVSFAQGYILVPYGEQVTFEYTKSQPKVDKVDGVWEYSNDVYTTSRTDTYAKMIASGVTVTFKDGETTLASVTGAVGSKVIGPAKGTAPVLVADGWVYATETYAYTIPADATEDITVDISEAAETGYIYSAGEKNLYMNYKLGSNLQLNIYRPEIPEGVTNVVTTVGSNGARTFTGEYIIGGKNYTMNSVWPGANNADNTILVVVTFTYGGQNITVEYSINVVNYAKTVIEIYGKDSKQGEQAIALLQYVEAANFVSGNAHDNGITEYLAELAPAETVIPETASDISALTEYIESASVVYDVDRLFVKFTFTEKAMTDGVTVKFAGTTGKFMDKENGYKGNGELDAGYNANDMYVQITDIIGYFNSEQTVEIVSGEEVIASGTYGIASYATENAANLTEYQLDLLQATYALAIIGKTV